MDSAAIKAIRKRLHINQMELAAILNVSIQTVHGWEQGKREPNKEMSETLKRIGNRGGKS